MTQRDTNDMLELQASADQFRDPINFIRQEHDRHFNVCNELDDLLSGVGLRSVAQQAVVLRRFFTVDLARHIQDEEIDLFPALALRCGKDAGAEIILDQLASEHELDKGLVDPILKELDAIIDCGAPLQPTRFITNVRAFVETQRRHLLWENRIVLPLAEEKLTAADRKQMAVGLATRRRVASPDGEPQER